jgi:hypothetical protein
MLQIVSGKFFNSDRCYETPRTGTFYTNYRAAEGVSITTIVGDLSAQEASPVGGTLAYNIVEKIEWAQPAPGVLIATGGRELVSDFATVVSFALNVICATDQDLVHRLTSDNAAAVNGGIEPRKYLRRVFDASVASRPEDAAVVSDFFEALIGLERKSFEAAIRAIRRYVTATHRIADDTDLAYSLFVMSIEALAQTTDAAGVVWTDYDEGKRGRIDNALADAPGEVADAVRSAVLKNEFVAMSRRFRAFTVEHLTPEFFRADTVGSIRPIARPDLEALLKRAYEIRSGYVHRLNGVPKMLAAPFNHAEVFEVEGQPTLSFEGLARLARYVISQFVGRAPKVEHEAFDWFHALPNLFTAQLAPQYWIGRADGYGPETALMWLKAFLGQVSLCWLRTPGATVTTLDDILNKIEAMPLGGVSSDQRRSIITLYHLFVFVAGPEHKREKHQELLTRYERDFKEATVEELVVHLVIGSPLPWTLDVLDELHSSYYRKRHWKNSLTMGELFETMFTLRLAELNRVAGNETRARRLVAFAVEACPANAALRNFEAGLGSDGLGPIDADKLLLPAASSGELPA